MSALATGLNIDKNTDYGWITLISTICEVNGGQPHCVRKPEIRTTSKRKSLINCYHTMLCGVHLAMYRNI